MLAAVGNKVEQLHRAQIGALALPELAEGEWLYLNAEQVAQALMSQILQGKQMTVKLHYQGGFAIDLVPDNAVMIDAKNIPELVSRSDMVPKEQLPLIMQNAMDRLVK